MADGRLAESGACPRCGGHLGFDPGSGGLLCSHCREVTPLPPPGSRVVPWRYELWATADLRGEPGAPAAETVEQLSFACTGCGAATVLTAGSTTGVCPYCKRAFVADGMSRRTLRPQAVLPLAVSSEAAGVALTSWLRSRWFAPNDLKAVARAHSLTAVYVPAWSFTADARTQYAGKRGDDRTEWRTVSDTDASGRSVTRQESRTVTDWRRVRGEVALHFQDVVIPASATITQDEEGALKPFDLDNAVPYQPEYVLGCACEQYSVTLPDGWARAQDHVDQVIVRAVEDDIGGDHQRISERATQWSDVLFLHLLLPIWVAVYTHRAESYRVLVNGRTAEVIGGRPYSAAKIALAVVAAIVAVAGLVLLYQSSQR